MWGVGQNRKGVGFGVFAEMGMVLLDVDCRFGEEDGISKRYAAFNEGREHKKKKSNLVKFGLEEERGNS